MDTQVSCRRKARTVTIRIRGRFDYTAHREFRKAYEKEVLENTTVVLDMAQVDRIDSTALGMLLALQERAGGRHADVVLENCSAGVREVLEVANFQKLFRIP